jgi:hypothetical protein
MKNKTCGECRYYEHPAGQCARFSKSPWRINGNQIISSEVNCFGGNTTVCRIHEQTSESKEIANAHLIVLAPKMYEKLQELHDDLISLANDCFFKNYDDRGDFWEQKANDIAEFLKQARGEK